MIVKEYGIVNKRENGFCPSLVLLNREANTTNNREDVKPSKG